jgi:hypothetical protein
MFEKVDISRFSQKALPIAKTFDKNHSGSLEKNEYNNFINFWQEKFSDENPLLMQLHLSSLNKEARTIAENCNKDSYEDILTGTELSDFIKKYKQSGLKTPFKEGVDLNAIIKGDFNHIIQPEVQKKKKNWGLFKIFKSGYQLFKNLVKKEVINYIGADKYFHAVGNFEGVNAGSEKTVKILCNAQDKIKRKTFDRAEADFAEDLYANWLGREMAKLYPKANPHELFEALAPNGFDIEKAKMSWVKLWCKNRLNSIIKNIQTNFTKNFQSKHLAEKN